MRGFLYSLCVWLLVASGTFLLVCGGMDYWESRSAQREIAQEWQDQQTVEEPAPEVPSTGAGIAKAPPRLSTSLPRSGSAVAKLSIPRLDTVLYVVEGTDDRDLKRGPGHLEGSVMPGEDGNCVIAGHRDTHFRVLKNIHDGDEIILERSGHRFRYKVDGLSVVSPDNTASLRPSSHPVLNLITCYPFHYVGSAPKRFIVHADLENSPLEASR
jgi:sortase A